AYHSRLTKSRLELATKAGTLGRKTGKYIAIGGFYLLFSYSFSFLYLSFTLDLLLVYLFLTYSLPNLYLFYTYPLPNLYLFYTYSIPILYQIYTYSLLKGYGKGIEILWKEKRRGR